MGSTYQSNRLLPKPPWRTFINGVLTGQGLTVCNDVVPQQYVVSYRSGKSERYSESKELSDETGLLSGGTAADTFKKLKKVTERYDHDSYDNGHNFDTQKWVIEHVDGPQTVVNNDNPSTVYRGTSVVYPSPSFLQGGTNAFSGIPSWDPTYYGTTAIALTSPLNPNAGLAEALAELYRDGIPTAVGSALFSGPIVRGFAQEYLNIEFGLKPLINDIRDLMDSIVNASRIIDQYVRDSGRVVRRKHSFKTIRTTTSYAPYDGRLAFDSNTSALQPWKGTANAIAVAKMFDSTEISQKIRFSGGFTYYVPSTPDFIGKLRRFEVLADRLLGLELTPEVLWNLAPWSWLADWNATFSSYLRNLEAFKSDGLLLKYGYIMRHTTYKRTVTATGATLRSGRGGSFSTIYRTVRKERVRANPFGFALNPTSYTSRQWAILAALGLSKGPQALYS